MLRQISSFQYCQLSSFAVILTSVILQILKRNSGTGALGTQTNDTVKTQNHKRQIKKKTTNNKKNPKPQTKKPNYFKNLEAKKALISSICRS